MADRAGKATKMPKAARTNNNSPSEQQSSASSWHSAQQDEQPAATQPMFSNMAWTQSPTHASRESSAQSQAPSVLAAPLKARRGMLNEKRLTINVTRKTMEPAPDSARSPRNTASLPESRTARLETSEDAANLLPPTAESPVSPMNRPPSSNSFHFDAEQERPRRSRLLSQQIGSARPPSISITGSRSFHLPFSPAIGSAGSGSSGNSSNKTAVASPQYGVNPAFGSSKLSPIGSSKLSPIGSSPKSGKTPRSPWFRRPTLPKDLGSPLVPVYQAKDFLAVPGSPRTPMTPKSQKSSPGSYQGMMLTTTTARPSDGKRSSMYVDSPREQRRASFTTELRNFVKGGGEVVPRLELRVLDKQAEGYMPPLEHKARSYSVYPGAEADQVSPSEKSPQKGRSRSHSLAQPAWKNDITSPNTASPKRKVAGLPQRASMPLTELHMKPLADRRFSVIQNEAENADEDEYVEPPVTARLEAMRRPSYAASVFQQAKLLERKPSYYPNTAAIALDEEIEDEELDRPPTSVSVRRPQQTVEQPLEPVDSLGQEPQVAVKPKQRSKASLAVRNFFLAPVRFLAWQISPKFIWTIIDPREYLWPITVRKVALYVLYGAFIAGLVMLDYYFHWWRGLSHALHGKNYIVMGILYGFEPAMILIIMLVADVPMPRQAADRTVLLPRGTDSEVSSIMDDSASEHTKEDGNLTTIQESTPPKTPKSAGFNPRARRATIIMHEHLDLEQFASRRPSAQSNMASISRHQSAVTEEKTEVETEHRAIPMYGHPSLTETTALVIPCHNSDVATLQAVLFAALVHFEPWQIFIIDNSNCEAPPMDLEGAIRSQPMFKRVNYVWLPVGNKNISQFVGATAAAKFGLKYVLTIDDDVIIPPNFAAPMHLINEKVTAVCYPITAVDTNGDRPLFVGWQDIEYKMSALSKMAESKLCGVLYPHGAASFWVRETMIQVLRNHDLIYFADDVKMGLELQALGQHMGIDASISFETVAPETFLGPSRGGAANFYTQRVRSWEMARHTLYWQFAKRFLFSLNGATTPVAIGWQKFTQFYVSTGNFIDWIRLPVFVILGGSKDFWLRSFGFFLFLPMLPLIPYRFWKVRKRPDLHPHMLDMLTYGIYKLLFSFVCILGALRGMLVFFPNHKHKPNLVEMENADDPRCIWLRPAFMEEAAANARKQDEEEQLNVLVPESEIIEKQDLVHELRN